MKKQLLFLGMLMLATNFKLKAQDTIIKRNQEQIIAKILEINPTEIKYKRFSFQDGPLYIDPKSQIKAIHFANGVKEEFKEEPITALPNPTLTAPLPTNPEYYGAQYNGPSMTMLGNRFRYKGVLISEMDGQNLMNQTKDKRIIALTTKAKNARGLQFIGFAAIPLGIAAGYCLSYTQQQNYNYQTNTYSYPADRQNYYTLAAIFGTLAVACPVESILCKFKRNSYNQQAVSLYNEKY